MQKFLLRAPSWVIALLFGGLFALMCVVVGAFDDESWRFMTIMAVAGGVILGPLIALATRKQRREQLQAFEQVPEEEWKQVRRAAWKGPVPSDPRIRAAALELTTKFYTRAHRLRWLFFIVFGLNLVLQIVSLAFGGSRWTIVTIVCFAIVIVLQWYNLRRAKARIELLR
ncbi:hypothetical protein ACFVWG_39245 [Kribbella sp. NPDC058245]|uniref:hypothetical protein n=1 Tax=Kribbella sp. NPDC058245 TaxID=3346399 RepID=UPI0036ECA85A